jgi:hypothetical protein
MDILEEHETKVPSLHHGPNIYRNYKYATTLLSVMVKGRKELTVAHLRPRHLSWEA